MKTLHIRNFKAIRDLTLDCKKVNLFIGSPNTGKPNILEALGLLSGLQYERGIRRFVRLQNMSGIFNDKDVTKEVLVSVDRDSLSLDNVPKILGVAEG
ncbi:MAG: AAA family ATPase, partial [archaeon]|nr:AAA family ATPase [archaeon]